MEIQDFAKYRNYILIGILALLTIFVLWLRLLPFFLMGNTDPMSMAGSDDPMYNLRLVELTMKNFPAYNWFEPMTLFPTGQTIHWGPLFTLLSAVFVMLAGASTRPEIITYSLMVPCIFAALMVPLVFLLVQRISDWKCGIFAAALTAIMSGQYFFRSLYGYFDHHIAEVFFGTLFILAYICYLGWVKEHPLNLKKQDSLLKPVILACFSGVAFVLGFAIMPTMIVFALIIGIFTIIQFIWDFYRRQSSEYLVFLNVFTFAIAIIGAFLIGIQRADFDFSTYTYAHPIAFILLIVGTIILYYLARFLKGKPSFYYPAGLVGIGIVVFGVIALVAPSLFNSVNSGLSLFFGQNSYFLTIQEARSWTIGEAWETFNYSLILMAGGLIVLFYRSLKEERPDQHVILIWSVIMLYATWQHIRYEYYLAANIAILGGICIGFVFTYGWKDLCRLVKPVPKKETGKESPQKQPSQKGKKSPQKSKSQGTVSGQGYIGVVAIILVVFLALLYASSALSAEYAVASSGALRMNPDWKESLEWMNTHTPDPGVDYSKIYSKTNFTYPSQAYGVMSWWDYGHLITYIAKRIPNANPFQAGVAGPYGAAAYFISENESNANNILNHDGTKYVVTDIEMDTGKFWAMATWFNATAGQDPYEKVYLVPDQYNTGQYSGVTLYDTRYYQTMISKLHNFDGSMAEPTTAYYVEYTDAGASGKPYPVITGAESMDVASARAKADRFNSQAPAGQHAAVLNTVMFQPLTSIPALQHYRLIHESPRNVVSGSSADIKYVKVFEYVKGAKIKGDGIIEIPLVSNTGRNFVYRQASINGEFTVPYSTIGNPYDVKATGKYHIIGTERQFDVTEEAVQQGTQIN